MIFFIKLLLFSLVTAGVYYIFVNNIAVFSTLLEITPADIVALLVINFIFLLLFAFFQKSMLLLFSLKQTRVEWVGLAFIASFYNLFLPAKGGSAIRSAYLKKKYGFSYKRFIAYLIKQSIYMLIAVSFMAGIFLFFLAKEAKAQSYIHILGSLAIAFSLSVYLLEKQLIHWLSKKKKVKFELEVSAKSFWQIMGVIALLTLSKGCAFYLAFTAINYPISFDHSLLVASLIILSNLVSILPGNIGIRELLMGGVLQLFGYDLSLVILASLLDRAANMTVTIMGALIFKYFIFKELYENE